MYEHPTYAACVTSSEAAHTFQLVTPLRQLPRFQSGLAGRVAATLAMISEARASFIPAFRLLAGWLRGPAQLAQALERNQCELLAYDLLREELAWDGVTLPQHNGRAGDTDFLLLLALLVRHKRPSAVVEFGAGLSTLILARALQQCETGALISYEHKEGFAELARRRLEKLNLEATVHSVPLESSERWGYPGQWYSPQQLPVAIDLLVIDGPPAYLSAGTRGAAAPVLFHRLAEDGIIVLDDGYRSGERANACRWLQDHPDLELVEVATLKGALLGRRKNDRTLPLVEEMKSILPVGWSVQSFGDCDA